MDPSARRQWLDDVLADPADREFAVRLERARSILARSGQSETGLFGAALEPRRVLDMLSTEHEDRSWGRKLRGELLWMLLFPAGSQDLTVLGAWVREIAVTLHRKDEKGARRLCRSLIERSRSTPPLFTVRAPAPSPRRSSAPSSEATPPSASAPTGSMAEPQPAQSSPSEPHPEPSHPEPAHPAQPSPSEQRPAEPQPAEPQPAESSGSTPSAALADRPAMGVVRWEIGLAVPGPVRVTLHDGAGRPVRSLFAGALAAGVHHCEADVPVNVLESIRPLGYVRVELPEGSWQQSAFIPN